MSRVKCRAQVASLVFEHARQLFARLGLQRKLHLVRQHGFPDVDEPETLARPGCPRSSDARGGVGLGTEIGSAEYVGHDDLLRRRPGRRRGVDVGLPIRRRRGRQGAA